VRVAWIALALSLTPCAASAQADGAASVMNAFAAASARGESTWRFIDPDALAELKAAFLPVLRSRSEESGILGAELFGEPPPLAEIEGLEPVAFLEALTKRDSPLAQALSARPRLAVLGSVSEGDDLEHFVVRSVVNVGGETLPERVDVMSLRRRGDGWFVELPAQVRGLIMMFIAADELQRSVGDSTQE
jgi:hypothetical protein